MVEIPTNLNRESKKTIMFLVVDFSMKVLGTIGLLCTHESSETKIDLNDQFFMNQSKYKIFLPFLLFLNKSFTLKFCSETENSLNFFLNLTKSRILIGWSFNQSESRIQKAIMFTETSFWLKYYHRWFWYVNTSHQRSKLIKMTIL